MWTVHAVIASARAQLTFPRVRVVTIIIIIIIIAFLEQLSKLLRIPGDLAEAGAARRPVVKT